MRVTAFRLGQGWFVTAGILLCLLAFALRVYRLDFQSIGGDEAYSVWRAGLPLGELFHQGRVEGVHPILHFLFLYLWFPLAGTSEYSLRFPSVFFGVLTLPPFVLLMRRLQGGTAALLAGLVAAIAPFWVYYGQEGRMYSEAVFFAVLSTYLLVRCIDYQGLPGRINQAVNWVGYGLAAGLGFFTHYYMAFVILAQAGYFLWYWWRRRQNFRWAAASAGIALSVNLPWLVYALPSIGRVWGAAKRAPLATEDVLRQVVVAFSAGASVSKEEVTWMAPVFLALAGLGMAVLRRHRALLPALLLVPIAGVAAVSFPPLPNWSRFFILATPAFYGLVGTGLGVLWRRHWFAGLCAAMLVVGASGISLGNYYFDPKYHRFDFRAQTAQVAATGAERGGVVANGDLLAFRYYFRGQKPLLEVPAGGKNIVRGADAPEAMAAGLSAFVADKDDLWLVKYMPPDFDPGGFVERWLADNCYRLSQRWVENITFTHYSRPATALEINGPEYHPVEANLDGRVTLRGWALDRTEVSPGSVLHLALFWEAQRPLDEDFTVFAQLIGPADRKAAQNDSQPAGDMRPTRGWMPGTLVVDRRGLWISADTPQGEYRIIAGMYRPANGNRLPIPREGRGPAREVTLGVVIVR
jgi:4-amino-4-deoxy-L-arabinose transferase-like glycosyltransferase